MRTPNALHDHGREQRCGEQRHGEAISLDIDTSWTVRCELEDANIIP
jgi:hypothetical protein